MEHYCQQEDLLREIHGDVKGLSAEVKAMNGKLVNTIELVDSHDKDSKPYRHKIDVIWSVFHTMKWLIMLIFGTGIIFKLFEIWTK